MADSTPQQRRKMGPFHWFVVAVWGVLCAWLVVSLIIGVVSALFYGDGPLGHPPGKTIMQASSPADAPAAPAPKSRP